MSRHLLLVCNSRSATISIHELDTAARTIVLRRDVPLPVPSGENSASPMALSADGRLLYLPWRGAEKKLMSFALDPERATLELVATLPLVDDICFLHLPPFGQYLLGAGGSNAIAIPLAESGLPQAVRHRVEVGPLAHSIVSDAGGRALATSCRGNELHSFTFDVTAGALLPGAVLKQPAGSGPRHICWSPNGARLYLVTQESGEVVVLSWTDKLREVQRVPMVDDQGADFAPMGGDIGMTPDGRFLYATERTSNRVVSFAIDPIDGTLRRMGWANTPDYPRALGIDPGGTFLTVLGFRGHRAAIFAIGETGELTPIADFATAERPSWVLSLPCP